MDAVRPCSCVCPLDDGLPEREEPLVVLRERVRRSPHHARTCSGGDHDDGGAERHPVVEIGELTTGGRAPSPPTSPLPRATLATAPVCPCERSRNRLYVMSAVGFPTYATSKSTKAATSAAVDDQVSRGACCPCTSAGGAAPAHRGLFAANQSNTARCRGARPTGRRDRGARRWRVVQHRDGAARTVVCSGGRSVEVLDAVHGGERGRGARNPTLRVACRHPRPGTASRRGTRSGHASGAAP